MTCYDFPDMVVHADGCPYTRGGICRPRPSSEAPPEIVRDYAGARAFMRGEHFPTATTYEKVPKYSGRSVDPHTGELVE